MSGTVPCSKEFQSPAKFWARPRGLNCCRKVVGAYGGGNLRTRWWTTAVRACCQAEEGILDGSQLTKRKVAQAKIEVYEFDEAMENYLRPAVRHFFSSSGTSGFGSSVHQYYAHYTVCLGSYWWKKLIPVRTKRWYFGEWLQYLANHSWKDFRKWSVHWSSPKINNRKRRHYQHQFKMCGWYLPSLPT